MTRTLFKTAVAALALFGSAAIAQAQDVTLTLQHFLGPKAPPHAKFLEPWARKVEAESSGRIKVEIFPAMALGGKPPELYRQLRDGVVDMVWTVTGYTPGVFPRTEVFELPTVHNNSAKATNLAIQDLSETLAEDFKDIKPLLVHVHAGNALHLVDGCVDSTAALAGKKLRTPSRTGAWMIESWGAEPVGMPVPGLPQALSKGVIDGALIPFEIVPPLKVHELTTCSVTGADNARFGTSVFLFGMNKDSYEALPDDLKAVIDANSGAAIAQDTGELWDSIEAPGQKMQEGTGSPVNAMDQAATDAFKTAGETVVQRWIEEASAAGLDAQGIVDAARAAIAQHTN
ncbi:MAG: TRAP transporter substrate-binding protein [Roseibium sp.]|nr:TRAP transporter substrate-binding protein [Roseibium sp.]